MYESSTCVKIGEASAEQEIQKLNEVRPFLLKKFKIVFLEVFLKRLRTKS